MVAALLSAAAVLFTPSSSNETPYLSALSDLAASSVMAAPACDNKICGSGNRLRFACVKNPGTNCTLVRGGSDCEVTTFCN
jgi:hypothetical protein